jgi:hypothetical protein
VTVKLYPDCRIAQAQHSFNLTVAQPKYSFDLKTNNFFQISFVDQETANIWAQQRMELSN